MDNPAEPSLSYQSHNASQARIATILLIHGASSSPTEFKLAAPFFPTQYHLLIPSLPGHGSSIHIKPFTLPLTCRLLASLIRAHAHDGRAHVVGMSLGAHVALYLASHYPDLVQTVFVSGYARLPPPSKWVARLLPYLVTGGQQVTNSLPRSLVRYFMSGASLDLEGTGVWNVQLSREVLAVLCATDEILPLHAKCLVVAATKRGLVPSDDSVEDAKMVGRAVRGAENKESMVVQMKEMRHPWDMQAPELFARCVVAWVEGTDLPAETEEMNI